MSRQELHPRTIIINKAQKLQSKNARNDALSWLAEMFPEVFDNTKRIRPLKTGIMTDILMHAEKAAEAGISKSKIREAVVLFTRRIDYLTCLKSREMRIDLQGNPVEAVTEDEAERAALKIKKRIEKSVRNARKTAATKINPAVTPQPSRYTTYNKPVQAVQTSYYTRSDRNDFDLAYSDRQSSQGLGGNFTTAARSSAVVVKHKTSKQFDPNAVARLKEKLGLSRKAEEKETVE
ncbi:ProQ/FinO family protein [Legionella dresdenensis]|uniref:ProQ/FinO family protein n=1 Tax=Legionella dresdenensis TaxID=450200 RepID=A0ABV8CD39_9GAMM